MSDNGTIKIDKAVLENDAYLKKTVEAIVQHYKPVKIYLFGSQGRGDAGPNSDYDLLVVVEKKISRKQRSYFYAVRRKFNLDKAMDVVIFTKEGFESRLSLKASLPSAAVEEGKLLYAA